MHRLYNKFDEDYTLQNVMSSVTFAMVALPLQFSAILPSQYTTWHQRLYDKFVEDHSLQKCYVMSSVRNNKKRLQTYKIVKLRYAWIEVCLTLV